MDHLSWQWRPPIFLHHPSNKEIYCSYVLSRYGQGVATTRRSMRRHVRRATPLSPLTRQYIHLHFLTSGPLLTVHVIHSITCKSLFLCPLLLRTWEPPQRHYWGDLLATFHFLRWRQHFWNPPIKVADNVAWPDNVASAQVTSSRALPIWDFDRPTKREVATPECFDSWASYHQTRRWVWFFEQLDRINYLQNN